MTYFGETVDHYNITLEKYGIPCEAHPFTFYFTFMDETDIEYKKNISINSYLLSNT